MVFQYFEQAVQLLHGLLLPVELRQTVEQVVLLAVEQDAVG